MQRRSFIKNISALGLSMYSLNDFKNILGNQQSDRLPLLFIGHGNPMNAIEDNEFNRSWKLLGAQLSKPKAILCVSAHWLTKGTWVTAMQEPRTIHDFGGFPDELFAVQYTAPGAVDFAQKSATLVTYTVIKQDHEWGLDHGCWSVLLPMFPEADIPVFQLSIDYTKPASYHFELAKQLNELRKLGVLIIGSGNIVHNLGMINWNNKSYDWAVEFDQVSKSKIDKGDYQSLVNYDKLGSSAKLSIPSNDHFLPLIYILGLKQPSDKHSYFNETITMGSISMRSVIFN